MIRTRRAAAAAAAAATAGAALTLTAGVLSAGEARAAAQLELVPVDGTPRTLLARTGAADTAFGQLGWSPDGASITLLRGADHEWDQVQAAVLRQPVAGGPSTLLRSLAQSGGGRLSPDGRTIAELPYRTAAGRIRPLVVRDVATGAVRARVRPVEPPQTGPIFVTGAGPGLCWSPDGRLLSIVERHRRGERATTRVLDVAAGRTILTRRVGGWSSGDDGCFAPGGRVMVARRSLRGQAVRMLDLVTGAESAVPDAGRDVDGAPAWAPDGRRLAYPSGEGIAVVDAATGRGPTLPIVPSGPPESPVAHAVRALSWSPDGRTLAVVYDESDGAFGDEDVRRGPGLYVLPADGSAPPRELVRASTRSALTGMAWSPDGTRIALASVRDAAVPGS